MNYLMMIMGFILAAAAIILYKMYCRRAEELSVKFGEIRSGYTLYSASVLDVNRQKVGRKTVNAVIVQFRIEEQRRTVVYRITEKFYKKYKRGDNVDILFLEGKTSDTGLIAEDNIYVRMEKLKPSCCLAFAVMAVISGIVLIIFGAAADF